MIHLTVKNLRAAIEEATDEQVGEADKSTFMVFIRRHMHNAFQIGYLAQENPCTLWIVVAKHFNHLKDIFFPEKDTTDNIYASNTSSL